MKDRQFFFRISPAIAGLFVVALAHADVPVVESTPVAPKGQSISIGQPAPLSSTNSSAPAGVQDSLFYQIELMQQELQTLRGMVEEQGHALRLMKQDQRDRYIDLDRRITQGGTSLPAVPSNPSSTSSAPEAAVTVAPAGENPELEKQAYTAAFKLIKDRKFDEAIASLDAFLAQYPNGIYAANARYWLGEVYLATSKPEQAKVAFQQVLTDFPKHRKAPDAGYKLGRVYVMLGDKNKAREAFEMTVSKYPGAPSAQLSEEFLKQL